MPTITRAPQVSPPVPISTPPSRPWYLVAWRIVKALLIFLIVAFHLVVLAIRNPMDIWETEIPEGLKAQPAWGGMAIAALDDDTAKAPKSVWEQYEDEYYLVDRATWRFINFIGLEQRWTMFSPPMARDAEFLAIRIEFTDGTQELLRSDNEPHNPDCYFRIGGWQGRKLEDYLSSRSKARQIRSDPNDKERKLWEAYARLALRRWRAAKPGDPRQPERIVFVLRCIPFLAPGEKRKPITETELITFDSNGRVLP